MINIGNHEYDLTIGLRAGALLKADGWDLAKDVKVINELPVNVVTQLDLVLALTKRQRMTAGVTAEEFERLALPVWSDVYSQLMDSLVVYLRAVGAASPADLLSSICDRVAQFHADVDAEAEDAMQFVDEQFGAVIDDIRGELEEMKRSAIKRE
ncbi:MAG: hypothetical protein AAFP69_01070 [Planctomycetota bacterium]